MSIYDDIKAGRPPIEKVGGLHDEPATIGGHVFQQGSGWWYPCRGCGLDGGWGVLATDVCPTPYRKPDDIPTMTAVLVEIRDEARAQTAILRALAEAQGVDLDPWRCRYNIDVPPTGPPTGSFGPRCTLPRGHFGRCQ